MKTTTNCVICTKPAVIFGGHVHKDKEIVIAGTCRECNTHIPVIMNDCKGCYGQWIPAYGVKNEGFSEVRYVDF